MSTPTNLIPEFTIIYGTQTGTSKRLSEELLKEAQEKYSLKCNIKNTSEIKSINDFNNNSFLVFIVSTYGNGDPSNDSIEFTKMISDNNFWKDFTNENLHYSIFGLGNSNYPNFNNQAKRLEKIFVNKMKSVTVITLGDSYDNINDDFNNWKNYFFNRIFSYFEEEKIEIEKNKNKKEEEIKPKYLDYEKYIPEILIIYGTQSGNAKKFSDKLLKDSKNFKLKITIKNASEIKSINDFNNNNYIILIFSTFGNGDPTEDSIEFTKMISEDNFWKNLTNKKIYFSIFGLGDSIYSEFNAQAKRLNSIFNKYCINVIPSYYGDDSEDIQKEFYKWEKNFFDKSYDYFKYEKLKDLINKIPEFLIIYGSETGNSKNFAEELSKEYLEKYKIKNIVKNASEINSIEEFNEYNLIVLFLSTFGNGDPTTDSVEFTNMIKDDNFWKKLTNDKLYYCIFGCGSSSYQNFNGQSKRVDSILSKKIKSVMPLTLGDDFGNLEEDFINFKNKFFDNIIDFFQKNPVGNIKRDNLNNEKKESLSNEKFSIELSNEKSKNEVNKICYKTVLIKYLDSNEAEIEKIEELRQKNTNGSSLKILFNNISKDEIIYSPAENFAIYPKNIESEVDYLINRLNYNPNLYLIYNINDSLKNQKLNLSIPNNLTIKEILTNIIDFKGMLNKKMLDSLIPFIKDDSEKTNLKSLISDSKQLNNFTKIERHNFLNLTQLYPSLNIPFLELIKILPIIQPRYYTVASSNKILKNKFELAITIVNWKNYNNEIINGLVGNYMTNLYKNFKKNEKVKFFYKKSTFTLPENIEKNPLLMICTGTGISPYISFLKELSTFNKEFQTYLIFGSKNKDCDFLYKDFLEDCLNKKILKELYTAFSRDQKEKIYVQDILEKNFSKDKLLNMINNGLIIYICGSSSMGKLVEEKLESIIGKEEYDKLFKGNKILVELWEN